MFRVQQLRKTRRINDVTGQTLKPKSTLWLNWSTACHSVPDQLCPGDKKQVQQTVIFIGYKPLKRDQCSIRKTLLTMKLEKL